MQGSPLYIPSLLNNRTMKLLVIYSILLISLCKIFVEKENIMNYNFVGLFLIFTNFFCNIIIKLQDYYITPAIQFTVNGNQDNRAIPFLDTLVTLQVDHSLSIIVYHKPTHTDQYLQWDSNHTVS